MKLKKMILPAFAVTALMSSTGIVSVSYAQKGAYYTGTSDWSVLDVVDSAHSSKSYCAAAKRYNPSSILTFAKNQDSELSLALDFQDIELTPAQVMEVVLDPGAGQQRSYDITPASQSAFVVRFGEDASFVSALQRTGFLRVEFSGQSYSFDIADIDGADQLLNDCLADIKFQKPVVAEHAGNNSLAVTSGAGFEVSRLKNEIVVLNEENVRLNGLLQAAEVAASQSSGQPFASFEKTVSDSETVDQLANRIVSLEEDNYRLEAMIKEKDNAATVFQRKVDGAQALADRVAELQADKASIQGQLDIAAARSSEFEGVKAELIALKKDHADLTQKLGESKTAEEYEEIVAELQLIRQENARLQKEMVAQSGVNQKTSEVRDDLGAKVLSLREENAKLSSELSLINAAKLKLEEQVASLSSSSSGDDEALKLLRFQVQEKDQKIEELKGLQEEYEVLKDEHASLKVKIGMLPEKQKEVVSLYDKVASLESENADLRDHVQTLVQENQEFMVQQSEVKQKNAAPVGMNKEAVPKDVSVASKVAAKSEDQKSTQDNVVDGDLYPVSLMPQKDIVSDVVDQEPSAGNEEDQENLSFEQELERELERDLAGLNEAKASEFIHPNPVADALDDEVLPVVENAALGDNKEEGDIAVRQSLQEFVPPEDFSKDIAAQGVAPDAESEMIHSSRHNIHSIVEALDPRKNNDQPEAEDIYLEASVPKHQPVVQDAVTKKADAVVELLPEADMQVAMSQTPADIPVSRDVARGHGAFLLERKTIDRPLVNEMTVAQRDIVVSTNPVKARDGRVLMANRYHGGSQAQAYESQLKDRLSGSGAVAFSSNVVQRDPVENFESARDARIEAVAGLEREDRVVPYERMAQKQSLSHVSYDAYYSPLSPVHDLLKAARVVEVGDVRLVEKASDAVKVAYQWSAQDVFGTAEQSALADPSLFEGYVQDYLEKTERRCAGDFAVMPDQSIDVQGVRADSYDIACVGNGVEASASLVFYSQDGTFTALVHEADLATMESAMTLKEQILSAIKKS